MHQGHSTIGPFAAGAPCGERKIICQKRCGHPAQLRCRTDGLCKGTISVYALLQEIAHVVHHGGGQASIVHLHGVLNMCASKIMYALRANCFLFLDTKTLSQKAPTLFNRTLRPRHLEIIHVNDQEQFQLLVEVARRPRKPKGLETNLLHMCIAMLFPQGT